MNKTFNKRIIVLATILASILFAGNIFNIVYAQEETANEKAQKLYEAMKGDGKFWIFYDPADKPGLSGLGTDEQTIFTVLESIETPDEKKLILKEYKDISGRRLADDLKDELNDSDYTRALAGLQEGSLYGSSQELESAKKQFEEVKTKLEQGESIEETEAERIIRESRERDIQKQSVKVFQENATKQKKPTEFVPLAGIPGVTDAEAAKDPSRFFNGMFMFGISIAAFLAVLMIAIGGIQYMSTDAVYGKSEGRERIQYAVMGLLLVLFSWILLRQINPEILNFNFLNKTTSSYNNTNTGVFRGVKSQSGSSVNDGSIRYTGNDIKTYLDEERGYSYQVVGKDKDGKEIRFYPDLQNDPNPEYTIQQSSPQPQQSYGDSVNKKLETDFQKWVNEQPDEEKRAKEFETWEKEFGQNINVSNEQKVIEFFKSRGY